MADHASAPSHPAPPSPFRRHDFLLRRLHSLTGLVPVGVFVIFHLFTNAQLSLGDFQHEVEFIHGLPALLFMEVVLWSAIAFHAALGLVYTFTGNRYNTTSYRYEGNLRYTLQRVTGIPALIFIFFHVATLRWGWDVFGYYAPFMVEHEGEQLATATIAYALQSPAVVVLYIIGSLSVIYHWSNGLWTAAITWGLTLSVQSQRRWGFVCLGMGLVLTFFLFAAMYGAMTFDEPAQQQMLQELLEQQ